MAKKNKASGRNKEGGFVFSTNPDFKPDFDENDEEETLPADRQLLYISLDRKQRKGKSVTLIEGFVGPPDELNQLG